MNAQAALAGPVRPANKQTKDYLILTPGSATTLLPSPGLILWLPPAPLSPLSLGCSHSQSQQRASCGTGGDTSTTFFINGGRFFSPIGNKQGPCGAFVLFVLDHGREAQG